jgi:hypothetical protein
MSIRAHPRLRSGAGGPSSARDAVFENRSSRSVENWLCRPYHEHGRRASIASKAWIDKVKPAPYDPPSAAPGGTQSGGVAERLKAADCKSADVRLRRFESYPLHQRFRISAGPEHGVGFGAAALERGDAG